MGKILMAIHKNLFSYIKSKCTIRSLKILLCGLFALYLVHPGRFNNGYRYFRDDVIQNFLIYNTGYTSSNCPVLLNASLDMVDLTEEYDNDEKWAKDKNIMPGGSWAPNCNAVFDIALVVPFRNRNTQLHVFLSHMHRFLQKQLIKYQIFVVEQAPGKKFNRGKLMNIGYAEALKRRKFPCFIFHDVDLIPQVLKNIYACSDMPRHMSASINIWRYNLLYEDAFGGVISILGQHFKEINGFSNRFFGWGAEDDDLLMRIIKRKMRILRFSPEVSRYMMLPHPPEPKNPDRFTMLKTGVDKISEDGLSSLNYQVINSTDKPLYTHIVVDV